MNMSAPSAPTPAASKTPSGLLAARLSLLAASGLANAWLCMMWLGSTLGMPAVSWQGATAAAALGLSALWPVAFALAALVRQIASLPAKSTPTEEYATACALDSAYFYAYACALDTCALCFGMAAMSARGISESTLLDYGAAASLAAAAIFLASKSAKILSRVFCRAQKGRAPLAVQAAASCALVAIFAIGSLLIDPAKSEAETSIEAAATQSFDSALAKAQAKHDYQQQTEKILAQTWAARQTSPKIPRD